MIRLWNKLRRYLSDRQGAYAVNFAVGFGMLFLAAHVGIDAMRVQNSNTGAEQLVDLVCQKIQNADPAIFPNAQALKAGIEKQMTGRRIAGVDNADGQLTIEPSKEDSAFVKPIDLDKNYVDLRRHSFIVRYDGSTKGLHRDIAANGTAPARIAKPCKPICTGMTNNVYSNAVAAGHWMDNGTLKVGQYVDDKQATIDEFVKVQYVGGYPNPTRSADRIVMTITSADMAIRYRRIINPGENFYLDGDKIKSPGEPSKKGLKRFVVDDGDQIFMQLLNADGSLPGMCGVEKPMVDCTGSDCFPVIGNPCDTMDCLKKPQFVCKWPEALPEKEALYNNLPNLKFNSVAIKFTYPTKDARNRPKTMGRLDVTFEDKGFSIVLAPSYVPSRSIAPAITFADGFAKTGLTREVASAYNFGARSRWAIRQYSEAFYLVSLSGSWWSYWWDGDEKCLRTRSPIVFDTHDLGNIITTRSENLRRSDRDPFFDYFGNGERVQVEWPIGAGQAWLVDNRDGRAATDMNGKRFFGDMDGHDDGYAKLRSLDTSGTGILSGSDLNGLALWFDNGNAIVEEGELRSLAELGISSVDANGTIQTLADGRDVLRATAIMNGRTIMTEDVFVLVTTPAQPIEVSELR